MPIPIIIPIIGGVLAVAVPSAIMTWGVWEGKKASEKAEAISEDMMKRNEKYQMYGLVLGIIGLIISIITVLMMYKNRNR